MDLKQIVAPPLDNNIYILGDDEEVLIIDAAGDAASTEQVKKAVGSRNVQAILVTHGHFDHIMGRGEFKKLWPNAPIYLHPKDLFLWQERFPATKPDKELASGAKFKIGDYVVIALDTPGHTPGSTCFYWPGGQVVFSGDTLFPGGPGATRWEYSSFKTIINSIGARLLNLPGDTKVLPGHGQPTLISDEKPKLQDWAKRGW